MTPAPLPPAPPGAPAPLSPPSRGAVAPVPAATVIPVRVRPPGPGLEVLLVRRHRGASFLANAFVFPGGRVDAEDGSPAVAAIRELFEEAGVLLARPAVAAGEAAAWRRRLLEHEASFGALLAAAGVVPDVARLRPWSRWVTPSFEPRRFDTRFFVAEVPAGAQASCDERETVEQAWVTPAEALAGHAAGTLPLPPPQLVTCAQLLPFAAAGLPALLAAAAARGGAMRPIVPRAGRGGGPPTLLMPWDAEYEAAGGGEGGGEGGCEGAAIAAGSPGTDGPSRLQLAGERWRAAAAPE